MLTHWIEVSMIGFGICLSTAFFLRSSFLKRKNSRRLEELQKNVENGLMMLGHQIELIDRHLQQVSLDFKDLTIRATILETRLEERKPGLFFSQPEPPKALSAPPKKRGRPPKNSK